MFSKTINIIALALFLLALIPVTTITTATPTNPITPSSTRNVDGDPSDWIGVAPSEAPAYAISNGELIITDPANDTLPYYRSDWNWPRLADLDLLEFRMTGDINNLYMLFKFRDMSTVYSYYIMVAFDVTPYDPSDNGIPWFPNWTDTQPGGTFGNYHKTWLWDYVISINYAHYNYYGYIVGVFDHSYTQQNANGYAVFNTTAHVIEVRVPWSSIGGADLYLGKTVKVWVAVFANDRGGIWDPSYYGATDDQGNPCTVGSDLYDLAGQNWTLAEVYDDNGDPGDDSYPYQDHWADTGYLVMFDTNGNVANSGWVKIFFTPDQGYDAKDYIINLINNAKSSIYVSMALWYNPYVSSFTRDFADALIAKKSSGIDVRVVLDNSTDNSGAYDYLTSGGVPVKNDSVSNYGRNFMHNKYFIIDNETLIIMSANIDYYAFTSDRNFIVVLNLSILAMFYVNEFMEEWNGIYHDIRPITEKPNPIPAKLNGTDALIHVYILPDNRYDIMTKFYKQLEDADKSIYFMLYDFTNLTIANLLISKSSTIDVRGIMEAGQYYQNSYWNVYDTLVDNGVLVTLDKENTDPSADRWYPDMHHKVIIIDEELVYFGSAQPTLSGWKYNDENVLVVNNTLLVNAFLNEFNNLWSMWTIEVDVNVYLNNNPSSTATVTVIDYGEDIYGNNHNISRNIQADNGLAKIYLVHPYIVNLITDYNYKFTVTEGSYTVNKTLTLSTGDTSSFTVYFVETSLSISGPATLDVWEEGTYTVTLTGQPNVPSTTQTNVFVDGSPYTTLTLTSGSGSFTVSFNTAGSHTISVEYNGETTDVGSTIYYYTSSSTSQTVTVNEVLTQLTIVSVTPSSPTEGDTITVIAKLTFSNGTDIDGATIRFVYNGTVEHTQTTNSTGYATDTYTVTQSGTLTIEVFYDGVSGKIAGSSDSTQIMVSPTAPPAAEYETQIVISGPSSTYVYESTDYTITLEFTNGTTVNINKPIDIYINGTKQTVTLTNGVYTLSVTPNTPGPLNITVVFNGATIDTVTYKPSNATTIVNVNKRPVNLTVSYSANWVNETHVYIEINGTVKDGLNGTDLSGTIKIWVRKNTAAWTLVDSISVTGSFSWNGTVDPSEVRVTFEPASPAIASPTEPGGGSVVLSLPVNPYIPAPEPIYIVYALLVAIIIAFKRRSK